MKKYFIFAAAVLTITSGTTGASGADPLKTMDDVGQAIANCWKPDSNLKGMVTLSFAFKRDGSLIGPPRPTNIAVDGDDNARKEFVGSAIEAIESCMPLSFSSDLAQGIGGQVFTMPFSAPRNSQDMTPMVTTQ